MAIRIWHQSFTVLDQLPAYAERLTRHATKILRPDTSVVLHGQLPGTYPTNYPINDLQHALLFALHSGQWIVRAVQAEREGFDAYAMCTAAVPAIREIRTSVDIPVIGYAESCFHLACTLGRRFAMMLFAGTLEPMMSDQVATAGLSGRFGGCWPAGVAFNDVIAGYENPAPVIEAFTAAARKAIAAGNDVIIPCEVPLNLLLASEGVSEIDGVPILDGLAVTLKTTEMMVDLKRAIGLRPSRVGYYGKPPDRDRLNQVLDFYGLADLARRGTGASGST